MTIHVSVHHQSSGYDRKLLVRQQMRRCNITNGELVYGDWTENVPPETVDPGQPSRQYVVTDTSRIVVEEEPAE